jgi:hypothetical protein
MWKLSIELPSSSLGDSRSVVRVSHKFLADLSPRIRVADERVVLVFNTNQISRCSLEKFVQPLGDSVWCLVPCIDSLRRGRYSAAGQLSNGEADGQGWE